MTTLAPRKETFLTSHFIHPARQFDFDTLLSGLRDAHAAKLIYERPGPDGLLLYVYSNHCVYESAWNPITLMARGLIVDLPNRRIAATPRICRP